MPLLPLTPQQCPTLLPRPCSGHRNHLPGVVCVGHAVLAGPVVIPREHSCLICSMIILLFQLIRVLLFRVHIEAFPVHVGAAIPQLLVTLQVTQARDTNTTSIPGAEQLHPSQILLCAWSSKAGSVSLQSSAMCHLTLLDLGSTRSHPRLTWLHREENPIPTWRGSSTRDAGRFLGNGKFYHIGIFISLLEILALVSLTSKTKTSGHSKSRI